MNYRYIKALGLSYDNISLAYDVITKKDGVGWMESCNIAVGTHYKLVYSLCVS